VPDFINAPWDLWVPSAEYLDGGAPVSIVRWLMSWGDAKFPVGPSRGQFSGPIARWLPGFFDLPSDAAFHEALQKFVGHSDPVSPLAMKTLADELLAHLQPTALRIDVDEKEAHRLDLVYILATIKKEPNAFAKRWIDRSNKLAYHEVFYVYRNQRPGGGLARNLLKGAISFYKKCGITRIELIAGFTMGGALWPRYGFRPKTPKDWEDLKPAIISRMDQQPDKVKKIYGPTVKSILEQADPRAIWDLSALKHTSDPPRDTLGWRLLAGTYWRGVLDLDDSAAMEICTKRLS
jgi:hypothetical protein